MITQSVTISLPLRFQIREITSPFGPGRCSPFGDNMALMPYFVLILLLFVAPVCAVKRKRDGVQFCSFHGERHFPLSGTMDLAPIRSYGATNAT